MTDSGNRSGIRDRSDPEPMPRWVKAFGIVVAILVVLVIAMLLIVGGEHGPGRHAASGEDAAPPLQVRPSVAEQLQPGPLPAGHRA